MAKVQLWKRRGPAVADTTGPTTESTAPDDATAVRPAQTRVADPDPGPGPGRDTDPADVLTDAPPPAVEPSDERARVASRLRVSILDSTPVTLFLAAHPRQALATAAGMAVAALAADRPAREAAVVGATVLVGQSILGWHNDIVDADRDARHHAVRKPIAEGRLDAGTAWFALTVGVLLVVPLSISTGVTAGIVYLASLGIGLLGNVALRRGRFSWLPWAASFALYPAYLSYGGWGGGAEGDPPQVAIVVLAALLGVGVHFLRAIWGLVADDDDGWTYLPLVLGRRLGATRLLVLAASYTAVVVVALVVVGATVGLRQ